MPRFSMVGMQGILFAPTQSPGATLKNAPNSRILISRPSIPFGYQIIEKSNTIKMPRFSMVGMQGIEPCLRPPEGRVLPVYYIPLL